MYIQQYRTLSISNKRPQNPSCLRLGETPSYHASNASECQRVATTPGTSSYFPGGLLV
jgi:hypothetical protein